MDISIKNLKKHIFEPKAEAVRLARAEEIVRQSMVVTEKVDGTKLTLVRTETKRESDYTKNWIVAYKGEVLSADEFGHLSNKERSTISQTSVGIGQYALVFDHLKRINSKADQIPLSIEFSVEFAQNKDTLTRTYVNKGGMFLRSYGTVTYRVLGGHLHTAVRGGEITDHDKVKQMAKVLEISSFPVFHQGNLSQASLMKNPLLAPKLTQVDWKNPLDVINKFAEAVLAIPSSLGGMTEGVVLKLANGQFFKLVQSDQYDYETRQEKKKLYRLEPEAATAYFQQIRTLIAKVVAALGSDAKNSPNLVSAVNQYVANNAGKLQSFFDSLQKISGGKKTLTQIKDDIHDTARLLVSKKNLLGDGAETLGLIPIAGKPLHIGHWKLIEKAAGENDRVVVYTSTSDRIKKGEFPIKGDDFVRFWTDYFVPALPKNVRVKFVESPVRSVMHELGWLEQTMTQDQARVPTVKLYSDKEDVESNFKDEDLKKYPSLLAAGKVHKVGVDRSTTVNVSGTKMREFLAQGNREEFFKYLPPIPDAQKEEIWSTLTANVPTMTEVTELPEELQEIANQVEELFICKNLLEGGWRTPETQRSVITPKKVAKVVSVFENEFITDFNRFSKLPPIKFGGPVGSAGYYKQDLDSEGVVYGDVDVQLILPVETNDREAQLAANKQYREKIIQFIKEKKPSYIIPHFEDRDYGSGFLVLKIDNEPIQVDLVISYTISASWAKIRTTPEKGIKGFVSGQLMSALSSATQVVLGANTNPHINTGTAPVFFNPNEIFLDMLKYFSKLAGAKTVDTTSLKGQVGLDQHDPSFKKKCEAIVTFANALMTNGVFEKNVIVAKDGTVLNSRDKFLKYVLDTFIEDMEKAKSAKKLEKANTPEAMKNVETIRQQADLGKQIAVQLIREDTLELLTESGQSVASVDPKTPKFVNGQPAKASTKLKIVDAQGKDIHSAVSNDVRELVHALNEKVKFWHKNNPYIENGFIFNGSSQYLMDPQKFGVLSKYKDSFGDIDVIIPKAKLDNLESFLDRLDDNKPEWTPSVKNKLTKNFYYVGRTKSYAAIPDQLVTLWYYLPVKQVVQIDFEGDEMTLDAQGYEKPSEWTKFSKDSPWEDLTKGIKGLAGALLLRSLARGATVLPNAVVLTPGGYKRVMAGATELSPKDITISPQHAVPSAYTLNTGGGGTGVRKAYQFVKTLPYNGKKVNAYRFIEARDAKPEDRITNVSTIFEIIFKRKPSHQERNDFRSFQGLLRLMKQYLNKTTIDITMKRFTNILAGEALSSKERGVIAQAVKEVLGLDI